MIFEVNTLEGHPEHESIRIRGSLDCFFRSRGSPHFEQSSLEPHVVKDTVQYVFCETQVGTRNVDCKLAEKLTCIQSVEPS